jgi:hypothetical protein
MAEKRTIELEIQDNSKSLKQQYREAVKELQNVAAAYGETSAEAVKAAQKAADLKDQIGFTNDLVGAFNPDAKFNALSKSIGGVLDGFQAVQGGLGLIGVQGEAVEETMLKVQSAMALSQGIQGVFEAKDSFKQLGTVIKDTAIKLGILTVAKEADTVATVANTVALEAQAEATGDASTGFKNMGKSAKVSLNGIKGAIAATGIGLLVIALGAVVAYWDDIKEAVSGVSDEQTKLNEKTTANLEASEAKVSALDKQDNILKLQGKSEKEILQLKITELDATIKIAETNLENQKATKKAQVEAAKRNRDILVGIIDFIAKPLEMLLKGVDKVAEYLGQDSGLAKWFEGAKKSAAELIFDPEETASEGDKAIKAAEEKLTELKNQQAGFQLSLKEINKQGGQSNIDNKKAELDALIELEIRKDQTDKARLEKLLADRLALEKLKGSQLVIAEQDNAEKVRQAIADDNKEVIKLETVKIDKLKVLSNTKLENLQGSLNAEVEAEKNAALLKTQILEAQAVRAQKIDENANSFKVKSIQQGLEIVSSITELFGKKSEKQAKRAFQVQKAAQVASALINTYQSATGAYASQFLPVPDPTSPVRGGIAAGLAVAAGLVNVAKIASQKFEGGSQGGGGGAPSGSIPDAQMAAPQFQTIGTSGVNQLATLQQQPTKAYVVSGEVTSAQSLDRNRVQNATL